MDEATRRTLTHALGEMMSEECEDYYSAGWLINWEEDYPKELLERIRLVEAGYQKFTERETSILRLADLLGHWATITENDRYDEPQYQPYHLKK